MARLVDDVATFFLPRCLLLVVVVVVAAAAVPLSMYSTAGLIFVKRLFFVLSTRFKDMSEYVDRYILTLASILPLRP